VTHPFHPLLGKSFELLAYRKTWAENRVYFHDDGRLRALPAGWTDAVEPPVFVALAAGRAHFRPDDLLRLAELVRDVEVQLAASVSSPQATTSTAATASRKLCRRRKDKHAGSAKRKKSQGKAGKRRER
jgi:hypothetical protein